MNLRSTLAIVITLVMTIGTACTPQEPEPTTNNPSVDAGPDTSDGPDIPDDWIVLDDGPPFPVGCVDSAGGEATIEYEIHPSTTSYMLVPFTSFPGTYDPRTITTPSGYVIDLHNENLFQLYGLEYPEIAWINPMVFPPAPNYDHQLEAGLHTLHVLTDDPRVCFYVIEDQGPSNTLDLNFYFVGLDALDLNAATADTHPDFSAILTATAEIFAQAGITLGEVRFLNADPDVAAAYSNIRDYDDLYALIETSEYPGESLTENLSLNVFLAERFTDGSVGVAMGIPGVAAMHESLVAGIGITAEYIGVDADHNQFTANVLAHELGHFLGLFHTTEIGGAEFDNLDDTPECTQFNPHFNCPDAQNLMFPYADYDTTELTPDQAYVLQKNPLIR